MPTQYGRLLRTPFRVRDAGLLAGLQSQSPTALAEFLQLCNEPRSLDEQMPAPPLSTDGANHYLTYDPRLLAHLWARAGIFPAAEALAHVLQLAPPISASYLEMNNELLRRLWQLAEDGPALRELLRRRDPVAEIELLHLYNRNRSTGRLPQPDPRAGYGSYPRALLGLLWALADNEDGLRALGRQLQLAVPQPATYDLMSDELLRQLWKLAGDGSALEALWLREGLLPAGPVDGDTSEALLGYLCWHEQRTDARDELLRRYCLLDASREQFLRRFKRRKAPWPYDSADDFASDVTLLLLQQVESWDYLRYPTLENRLFRSVRNRIIDRIRQGARRRASGDPGAIDQQPAAEGPGEVPERTEELPAMAHRAILKAKLGHDLTDAEMDWSAERNLEAAGVAVPTPFQVNLEKARISNWLMEHPSPTSQQLSDCFIWHDPCKFDRGLRDWKLRQTADETTQRVRRLLHDDETEELAGQVEEAMTGLIKRSAGGTRRGRPGLGPVPLFAGMQEASNRLWHRLGQRPLDHEAADDFREGRLSCQRFNEQFPILLKLAACWRLVGWLIHLAPPAAVRLLGKLAGWLESGPWLATFPERDRQRCQSFAEELQAQRGDCSTTAQGGLDLLLLWLRSTRDTGQPETRLRDLDRAWWLSQGSPSAARLVAEAYGDRWHRVGEIAHQMLPKNGEADRMIWSDQRERTECLTRLHRGQSAALVKLASCRRLVDYLKEREGSAVAEPVNRLTHLLEAGRWQATFEEVRDLTTEAEPFHDGRLAALQLLGLWLRPVPDAGLPGQAVQDLDRAWSLSHEVDYNGPSALPGGVDALVGAAWRGNWSEVAKRAGKLAGLYPDGCVTAWSAHHEFCGCLQRLAERKR